MDKQPLQITFDLWQKLDEKFRVVYKETAGNPDTGFKYLNDWSIYTWEKLCAIQVAELKPTDTCIDISTGIGLLPAILERMGHVCDCTDNMVEEYNLDRQWQYAEFEQMREVLGIRPVHLNLNTESENFEWPKLPFTRRYDVMFCTRPVFERIWNSEQEGFCDFIEWCWQYADRVVVVWNYKWDGKSNKYIVRWFRQFMPKLQPSTSCVCVYDKYRHKDILRRRI